MSGLFEHISAFDDQAQTATKQAVAVAHKRFNDRFAGFLKNASSEAEFNSRLALVDSDLKAMVADVSAEYEADALKVEAALKSSISATSKKDADKGKDRPEHLKAQDEIQEADEHSQVPPWLKKQDEDEDQEDGGNLRNKTAAPNSIDPFPTNVNPAQNGTWNENAEQFQGGNPLTRMPSGGIPNEAPRSFLEGTPGGTVDQQAGTPVSPNQVGQQIGQAGVNPAGQLPLGIGDAVKDAQHGAVDMAKGVGQGVANEISGIFSSVTAAAHKVEQKDGKYFVIEDGDEKAAGPFDSKEEAESRAEKLNGLENLEKDSSVTPAMQKAFELKEAARKESIPSWLTKIPQIGLGLGEMGAGAVTDAAGVVGAPETFGASLGAEALGTGMMGEGAATLGEAFAPEAVSGLVDVAGNPLSSEGLAAADAAAGGQGTADAAAAADTALADAGGATGGGMSGGLPKGVLPKGNTLKNVVAPAAGVALGVDALGGLMGGGGDSKGGGGKPATGLPTLPGLNPSGEGRLNSPNAQIPGGSAKIPGGGQTQNAAPAKPANPFSDFKPSTPYIGIGDTGDQVKQIQKQIGATSDGVFGQQTAQKLQDYQQAHNIAADSVFGAQTLATMQGDKTPPAPGAMQTLSSVTSSKPDTGDSTEEREKLPTGNEDAHDGPSPKIDKTKWKPNATNPDGNLKPIESEGDHSPHPTHHQDIKQKPDYENEDAWENDNNIWKREQLKSDKDDNAGFNKDKNVKDQPNKAAETWHGMDGQTNPVTKVSLPDALSENTKK